MLEEKVLETIKKYSLIKTGEKVVVGVSGGPDSICLINVLNEIKNQLNCKLIVCHVNHMIREEAGDDEEFVKNYCKEKQIPFFVKHVEVEKLAKTEKIGTEEAGRKVRYDFFCEILNKTNANKIATAHTKNDNAETVLMNIIRGSGTQGLKGIVPIRDNTYIKPLININREEIEEYCKINKLNPRYDKTNSENVYTRNKVRNILIPLIKKEFNPNIIKGINNLSEIVTEEQNYLEKIVNNIYSQIKIEETKEKVILDLKEFNKQDTIIKKRILLLSISKIFGTSKNIERIHIEDIIKLCERNIGNKYLTPNKNVKVFVNKGKIIISHTY